MPPNMKHIILTNINVKVYSWPLTFHKVVQQQIKESGSFNSTFLCRSFLNLTVKKIMKIGPLVTKFCH